MTKLIGTTFLALAFIIISVSVVSTTLSNFDKNDVTQNTRLLTEQVSGDNIHNTIRKLSSFKNRRWDSQYGVDAAFYLAKELKQCAGKRKDISVELFVHSANQASPWIQPSVIAHLEGTTHPEQIVVIGGHLDSINHTKVIGGTKDDDAPGADDDASGTATAMEAFCTLARSGYTSAKSIEFMSYSAEEVGLWGSKDISSTYAAQHKKVIAVLQFDMVLWPYGKMNFINDFVDKDLTKSTMELAKSMGYEVEQGPCKYACSDHASWTSAGYPSVFPFEAPMGQDDPYIHSEKDTIENAGGTQEATKFAKLGVGFLIKHAN